MAFGKQIGSAIKKVVAPEQKKHKGGDFMHGLKSFFTSPGGIITIVMIIGVIWYVHHTTSHKGAKG